MSTTALEPSAAACLSLLSRLADPELSFDDLEDLVHRDAALTVLGSERLKSWVMLLVASDAGGRDKTRLSKAVIRARTCEILAEDWGARRGRLRGRRAVPPDGGGTRRGDGLGHTHGGRGVSSSGAT